MWKCMYDFHLNLINALLKRVISLTAIDFKFTH